MPLKVMQNFVFEQGGNRKLLQIHEQEGYMTKVVFQKVNHFIGITVSLELFLEENI